jgi:hypothetical protein
MLYLQTAPQCHCSKKSPRFPSPQHHHLVRRKSVCRHSSSNLPLNRPTDLLYRLNLILSQFNSILVVQIWPRTFLTFTAPSFATARTSTLVVLTWHASEYKQTRVPRDCLITSCCVNIRALTYYLRTVLLLPALFSLLYSTPFSKLNAVHSFCSVRCISLAFYVLVLRLLAKQVTAKWWNTPSEAPQCLICQSVEHSKTVYSPSHY